MHPVHPVHPDGPISEILPGLYIGTYEAATDIKTLMSHHITAMVSLTRRRAHIWDTPAFHMLVPEKNHLIQPVRDEPRQDMIELLPGMCDFIESQLYPAAQDLARIVEEKPSREMEDGLEDWDIWTFDRRDFSLNSGQTSQTGKTGLTGQTGEPKPKGLESSKPPRGNVLVHCAMGRSRSATVVAAYIMRKKGWGRDETLRFMKGKRRVEPIESFRVQLGLWEDMGYQPWVDEGQEIVKGVYERWLWNNSEVKRQGNLLEKKGQGNGMEKKGDKGVDGEDGEGRDRDGDVRMANGGYEEFERSITGRAPSDKVAAHAARRPLSLARGAFLL